MEARVLGDVNHPRHAEQRAVRIDHRRAVVGVIAVALVEVDHGDDAELLRLALKRRDRRSVERLGELAKVRLGRTLRIEPFEGELGETRQLRAVAGRGLERGQPARDVGGLVFGGVLLDQRNFH